MSKLISIVASALFLGYLVTELSSRFFAGDFFALLVATVGALLINGFFIARLADTKTTTSSAANEPARRQPRADKANRAERPQREKKRSDKADSKPQKANDSRDRRPAKPTGEGEKGTVKWFNRSKGYGFIVRANGDEIFVHQRSIVGSGDQRSRPVLDDGQAVEFIVTENERGVQAEQVYPLD